ncbi:MAG: hypothetical protein AAF517_23980, partial [Planctomycetota bacterium]
MPGPRGTSRIQIPLSASSRELLVQSKVCVPPELRDRIRNTPNGRDLELTLDEVVDLTRHVGNLHRQFESDQFESDQFESGQSESGTGPRIEHELRVLCLLLSELNDG